MLFKQFRIGTNVLFSIDISQDGKYFAVCNNSGEFFIFSKKISKIKINRFDRNSLDTNVLNLNNSFLYSVYDYSKLILWECECNSIVRFFDKNLGKIIDIDSKDNLIISSDQNGFVTSWDNRVKNYLNRLNTGFILESVKIIGNSTYLVSKGYSANLYLWDYRNFSHNKPILKIKTKNESRINSFCVSKNKPFIFYSDENVNIYKWSYKKEFYKIEKKNHFNKFNAIDKKYRLFLRNGYFDSYLGIFNRHKKAIIINSESGKIITEFNSNIANLENFVLHPRKRVLIGSGSHGSLVTFKF
jgi:hypothetical protein